MKNIDQILRELDSIARRIDAETDTDELVTLHETQAELRLEASEIRASVPVDLDGLKRELRGVELELRKLMDERVNAVGYAGGGNGGGDFGFATDAFKMNEAIDAATGRDELEQRVKSLRREIAELE